MILSDTQSAIREAVRSFAQERVRPRVGAFEEAGSYPLSLFGELAELGVMSMTVPDTLGGTGADFISYALALIELAAGDGALSTIVSVHNSLVLAGLVGLGTDKQHSRFLTDLMTGQGIGAFALTEADAGSDAGAIRLRATRVAGGWKLNGTKQFITSGEIASLVVVFAVTDPTAGKKGISAFLVPAGRPGYAVDKAERKLGQLASDTCAIRFDDLFVEDDLMLGAEGQGYRIALSNLATGRIGIAAQSIGMAQAALDIAVAYAKERKSFGKTIIEHQAVGFRLADLATRLEAARELTLSAAALKDAGEPCIIQASMAKLFASETAEMVCSGAIQTLGGYGYLEEFGVAKIYRDVRVCQIYEGTSDIQRLVIARSLSGD